MVINKIPNIDISNYEIKKIPYTRPEKKYESYSKDNYSFLFLGNGEKDISRYSFIGIHPHTSIKFSSKIFSIEQQEKKWNIEVNFWEFLERLHLKTKFHDFKFPANLCGGAGYFSYEIVHEIEKITTKTQKNYNIPDFQWIFFNEYFVFDNETNLAWKIRFNYKEKSNFTKKISFIKPFKINNISIECQKEEYIEKVKKIQEYILEGDVYEVNLSQQIKGKFSGNPYDLFKKLYHLNPAPYSAFLRLSEMSIVCSSPEKFISAENSKIETRPIKGTIERGKNLVEDEKNKKLLLNSKKDQAELFMIIDLLRNDIGKVCKYGTVKVIEPKRIEKYQNVYHLVGIIEGELSENKNYIDLWKATFPGGSITGCPKIRCMEIIEELETYRRNLYTGSLFMMNQKHLFSNIVIRTSIIVNDEIFINSGGAITIDSNPKTEYNETSIKLASILRSIDYENLL